MRLGGGRIGVSGDPADEAAGDGAAPELVRKFIGFRRRLLGFLFTLTRDFDAAEDILQDLSVTVMREAARGTKPENFEAWAVGVARHRLADFYHKQTQDQGKIQRWMELAETLAVAFAQRNLEAADQEEKRLHFLRACMEHLSSKMRRMVDARYGRGLAISSIAEELAWSPNSVTVALAKVRARLAECIDKKAGMERLP